MLCTFRANAWFLMFVVKNAERVLVLYISSPTLTLSNNKVSLPSFSKYITTDKNRVFYNKHISAPARILRCVMHGVWLDWAHINNRTNAYDEQQWTTCGMNLLHNPLYSHAYFSSYYSTCINCFRWTPCMAYKYSN